MTMIKKVARAIADDAHVDYALKHLHQARAAIEAMRGPTEEMLFAGQIDLGSGGELDRENLTEVYQLIITAALKE